MKPRIDKTKFGSITVESEKFPYDVLIRLDGRVKKRKKKLSKQIYGTLHVLSLAEAKYIYEKGVERLIFGTGQYDTAKLSDEAADFFKGKGVEVKLLPTPKAILAWNEAKGATLGLFHITC